MRLRSVFAIALLALVVSAFPVAAQESTPAASESLLAGLGYPELRITVTDEGVEAPTEVAADRYLVVVDNQSQSFVQANFMQLPEGLTLEEAAAMAEEAGEEDEDAAEEAEEAGEEEMPPDWYYEAILPGGAGGDPGTIDRAVVDLTAGEWYVDVFRDPEGHEESFPPKLTVTGDPGAPIEAPEPEGAIEIELRDHEFVLPEELPTGPQIWKVVNTGEQPHTIGVTKGPDTLTVEQVLALNEVFMTGGTPSPDLPNPETGFEDVGGSAVISAGQATWIELDLVPGTYLAVCWVPDQETGIPHLELGMIAIFTVG